MCSSDLLMARIAYGPMSVDWVAPRVADAVGHRIGAGMAVSLGAATLEYGPHGPTIAIADVAFRNEAGRTLVSAPRAEVSVALAPLLTGAITPTRFDLVGLDLRLMQMKDGAIALSVGDEPIVLARAGRGGDEALPDFMPALAGILGGIVDLATGTASPIGDLDRVGVTRGRLVFERESAGGDAVDRKSTRLNSSH